jgi:NTP pyrophosphatase (non-canonical NTP hydrolase)
MELNQYQELASRTANSGSLSELFANYALGLAGEAGEVADLLKKSIYHSHRLDIEELTKELGDVLWYLSQLAELAGVKLNVVAETNIQKLMKRYPDGFSDVASINREEYLNENKVADL